MYLIFHVLLSSIIIFLSRFVSNFRSILHLQILGDSSLSDIVSLCLSTIGSFRTCFTDGNLESIISFNFLKENKEGNAYGFVKGIFKRYGAIFLLLTLLFNLFLPIVSKYVYFLNSTNSKLFIFLSYFLSPTIILMFFSSVLSSVINSQNRFWETTTAISLGNISFLLVMFLGFYFPWFSIITGNLLYSIVPLLIMIFRERKIFQTKASIINLDGDIFKSSLGQFILSAGHIIINKILISMHNGSCFYYDYGYKIIFSISQFLTEPLVKIINIEISHIFLEKENNEKIWDYIILLILLVLPFTLCLYNLSISTFLKLPKIILGSRLKHPELLCKSLKIFSPLLILGSLNKIFNSILLVNKKQKIVTFSNTLFTLINILASICFHNNFFLNLVYIYIISKFIQLSFLFVFIIYRKILSMNKKTLFIIITLIGLNIIYLYFPVIAIILYIILSIPYMRLLFTKRNIKIK